MVLEPPALRSSYSFGYAGDPQPNPRLVPAATPRKFTISFPSTDWVILANLDTLRLVMWIERSLVLTNPQPSDWQGFIDNNGAEMHNLIGKSGSITIASQLVSWDGQGMLVRGKVTSTSSFIWGIDINTV